MKGILLRVISPSEPELSRLLEELEQSGLSVAAFARERGVPAHRLYRARRQARRKQEALLESDFTAVHLAPAEADNSPPSAIELQLPNGCSVSLDRDFDEVALRRVLTVVAQC